MAHWNIHMIDLIKFVKQVVYTQSYSYIQKKDEEIASDRSSSQVKQNTNQSYVSINRCRFM